MKKLIIAIIVSYLPNNVYANCSEVISDEAELEVYDVNTDVPKDLKGAVIIVKDRKGREHKMDINKFKVVPRQQQFIVTKVMEQKLVSCHTTSYIDKELKRSRIGVALGKGPTSKLDRENKPNSVTVETKHEGVGAIQYQYLVDDTVSIGGQIQTNQTGLLGVGVDF
jgi:hypothetical protein